MRLVRLAALLTGAVLAIAAAVPAAQAEAPGQYVALGDSYAAGSGNLPLSPGFFPFCGQSIKDYAHVLAAETGDELTDVACGGAQTKDFTGSQYPGVAPQLDAVSADTDLVTMTIGGNDAGTLAIAAGSCGLSGTLTLGIGHPCQSVFGDTFEHRIDTLVYPAVKQALEAVHARAPHARVVIVGYLWIMPATRGCFPLLPIASGDIPYLRALEGHLNAKIAQAAAETGTTFVDMSSLSDGHDACQAPADRWVEPVLGANGLTIIHPNERGEHAMADAVKVALAPQ